MTDDYKFHPFNIKQVLFEKLVYDRASKSSLLMDFKSLNDELGRK